MLFLASLLLLSLLNTAFTPFEAVISGNMPDTEFIVAATNQKKWKPLILIVETRFFTLLLLMIGEIRKTLISQFIVFKLLKRQSLRLFYHHSITGLGIGLENKLFALVGNEKPHISSIKTAMSVFC